MTANSQAASTLYQAIVDDIRLMIQDHRLSPGDQLPPMGKLAERYNVSVITAKRAISELQQLGLVRSVRGKGTFIAGRSASKPSATKASTTLKSITLMSNNADAKNTRSFMSSIWASIQARAEERGLEFRVYVIPDGGSDFHVDMPFRPEPDEGLILLAPAYPYRILALLEDRSVRAVMVDSSLSFAHSVMSDNMDGIHQLIDHHYDNGHRHILLASRHPRSPNPTNENEREAAFTYLTKQKKIKGEIVSAQDTDDIVKRIRTKKGPTAVMFTQDEPAMNFIEYANDKGISVPDEVSVSGFDGWVNFRDQLKNLTTLQVDRKGLGERAVELLLELSQRGRRLPIWSRVPGELIVGSTSGPS